MIGHPEWATDPAYNSLSGTMKNRTHIMARICEWAEGLSSEECEDAMSKGGVPCSVYRAPAEQLNNPHLIERGSEKSPARTRNDGPGVSRARLHVRIVVFLFSLDERIASCKRPFCNPSARRRSSSYSG